VDRHRRASEHAALLAREHRHVRRADVSVQVIDDPNVLFEAQFGNSTSVPAFADQGATFNLYDAGGNTSFATSGEGVDYTTLNTTALQFRFVGSCPRSTTTRRLHTAAGSSPRPCTTIASTPASKGALSNGNQS
jgi:hypothetical protein